MIDAVDGERLAVALRPATRADVPAMLAIKESLRLDRHGGARGGFLLGTSADGYRALIDGGIVWVLIVDDAIVGFASALADHALRASPLWQRRPQIAWSPGFDAAPIEAAKIGYFDQIAVLAGVAPRLFAAALGLRTLFTLLEAGHEHVLTTTVEAPILNRAALAFLDRLGARRIAAIDEVYPEVGALRSAIYYLHADAVRVRIAAARASAGPSLARVLDLAGV